MNPWLIGGAAIGYFIADWKCKGSSIKEYGGVLNAGVEGGLSTINMIDKWYKDAARQGSG